MNTDEFLSRVSKQRKQREEPIRFVRVYPQSNYDPSLKEMFIEGFDMVKIGCKLFVVVGSFLALALIPVMGISCAAGRLPVCA